MKDPTSPRHSPKRRDPPSGTEARPESEIPCIDSTGLLGAGGRVVIDHHGQRYELRETRFGKLILTK